MALDDYGVLVGTLHDHTRDRPDDQGRWFHVHLRVDAPLGRYECAVDVDSHQSKTGVQWKVLELARDAVAPLLDLDPGYHDLASTPESGAWDLIRHPALGSAAGPFATGSFLEATVAFEALLVPGQRTFVLGQPFDPPRPGEPPDLGMHEIHQNQGDPEDSEWSHLNAIWQDGGTMTERPDGTLHAFISKFSSQKDETGADGHPLHLNVSGAASEG